VKRRTLGFIEVTSGVEAVERRGVALMLVLWLVVVVSAIAAAATAATRTDAGVVVNVRARAAARYAAESGIVLARARLDSLLSATARADMPVLFKNLDDYIADLRDVTLGQARFAIAVEDLTGRLDLNEASEEALRNLFAQFTGRREARLAVRSILDWSDTDNVGGMQAAEADAYERAGSPFRPTNRSIRRVEELGKMLHVGDSLLWRVAPYVTVHGGRTININAAPETVLAAIPGLTREVARTLADRRRAGEVFTSVNSLYELLGSRFAQSGYFIRQRTTTYPTRLLVISRGWQSNHTLTHEIRAVYEVSSGRSTLRAWEERDL
jgi:general secretion pathway protein K